MPSIQGQGSFSIADFRPIALTCFLAKVMDKVISIQMIKYLETNRRFNPFQSSFRKHSSTQSALLRINNDVMWTADDKRLTILVLFVYTQAFDTIEHHLLVTKLRNLGLSAHTYHWIWSYLIGRRQCISIADGSYSRSIDFTTGVP